MDCSPAMITRNANGQFRHTDTVTSAMKLLSPSSQKVGLLVMPSSSCSTWLTRPLLYWNMNAQVITDAYTGSAYGVRKMARSTPRPRNLSCASIAAAQPNSQESPTASAVNEQVTTNECSRAWPMEPLKLATIR